mmetsp:Transcript_24220/g.32474  ORF Transcript_24220/g.32474 Transcript_24220/m.32474 type:complete len:122 (-) Transcript_24220:131-496(-)
MLNIDWLTADGNTFVDFVKILRKSSSDKIYQTDLLDVLLNEFWQENFDKILYGLLVPWFVYMLTMTYYYMTILQDGYHESATEEEKIYSYVLGGTLALTLLYQIGVEVMQSAKTAFLDYVT